MVPVVFDGCESWTIKKAVCWRIDAFELWCWRRLLRVPWIARRSNNQSWRKAILNAHWMDWSWSWNSNTLTTWCKELTHWERSWCWDWKQEKKGTTEDKMVGWHHRLNGHEFEQALGIVDWQGSLACYSPWGRRVGHDWVTELKWTELGFPGDSDGKESAWNAGEQALIPRWGRSPVEGNGNPLQYSCLENSMSRGAWWATIHRVAKSRRLLSN